MKISLCTLTQHALKYFFYTSPPLPQHTHTFLHTFDLFKKKITLLVPFFIHEAIEDERPVTSSCVVLLYFSGFFFLISNTGREYTRRREKNEKRKKIIYFYFLILLIDLMLLHFYYSFYFVVEQFLFSIISRRSGYTFYPHRIGFFFYLYFIL